MTKITNHPEMQTIIYCPGCNKRRPEGVEELSSEIGLNYVPCCSPKCQGKWGTGCYHCHHPQYWPHPLYVVTAVLKGRKKVKRSIMSFIRASTPGQAEVQFTEKLTHMLLVQHGCRWHITVEEPGDATSSEPSKIPLKLVGAYDHFARGATIYHEPTTESPPELPPGPQPESEPPEPQTETTVTEKPETQPERKITRDEALVVLRNYVSQQVEYEAIDIIECIINELAARPGEHYEAGRRIKIEIGKTPIDYGYNKVLQHAQALELGTLVPPAWLERFKILISQIREEFDLHEHVATPSTKTP